MSPKILSLLLVVISIGLISAVVIGSLNQGSDNAITADYTKAQPEQLAEIEARLTQTEGETNIYYWGTTCPYCHDVIDWLDESGIEAKIPVERKEVYENQENSLELSMRAAACGLNERNIGVPFLYTTEGTCQIGAPNIISYLEMVAAQESTAADVEGESNDEN